MSFAFQSVEASAANGDLEFLFVSHPTSARLVASKTLGAAAWLGSFEYLAVDEVAEEE